MQVSAEGDAAAIGENIVDALIQQQELIVFVGGSVLAILIIAAIWRWLKRTPAQQFLNALSERDQITILMHPNPDPDAMASALAVAALANSIDTHSIIQYPGQIRHPENRAFETVLDCDFNQIERASELAAESIVLVDHNESRGFEHADKIKPYAVIDHHPGIGEGSRFTDVRPDRGSTSSILADYFRDLGWSNRNGDGPSLTPTLATALLYGIQSDTTSFTRGCTPSEFDAAAYLFPATDADSLERIANPQVDSETLDVKAEAINERKINGSFLVSHVGEISNLDALPTAAEELVRLEGISVAVVTGESEEDIHISGRSQDDRVHMGKTLQAALDDIPNASAGGHARMGGGQATLLPVPGEAEEGHPQLTHRLFAAMNGNL